MGSKGTSIRAPSIISSNLIHIDCIGFLESSHSQTRVKVQSFLEISNQNENTTRVKVQ